ncbi:MAG: prolyl oligopeptidase family serine peptidase [Planctomycetota bacterium]
MPLRKTVIGHVIMTALLAGFATGCASRVVDVSAGAIVYPKAHKVDQIDDYHGVKVADPYRWLEDDYSEATSAWVEAQNEITFGYLEQIPARKKIKERLTELWNYEKYGVPGKRAGRYFFYKNDGLQNQSVLYTMRHLDDEPRVLLDPNKLSEDGSISLYGKAVSEDGRLLAYGLSDQGSDWQEWKIRDIETGKDLNDHLKWIKFSYASWTKDSKGFFYTRFDEPAEADKYKGANYFPKIYYHRLGTLQAQDVLIYDRPDQKEWLFSGKVTDDGRYLIIEVEAGNKHETMIFYKDLHARDAEVVELLNKFDAKYTFIDNDGPIFWFWTDLDAPRGRVVAIDTRHPSKYQWREVIPQARETLRSANLIGGKFFARYLRDAHSQVKVFDLNGAFVREVEFSDIGSAYGFGGRRDDLETFYAFSGFSTPTTIFHYNVASGKSTVFRMPTVDFDPSAYTTRQVFYESKDGTRVPMFITHKKGLKLDGTNPTYLYGYGGFDVSITPYFSVSRLVWMEMGGVFAVANIRGGGEYGKEWHLAGTKLRKQNVFDDFIAAAEWLIDNKYTSTPKLALGGASNGGTLVGACMCQRPDLFGACVPDVGVMDMLRFHKFTIGWAWVADYGSSDDPEEFKALYAYSPLHNLKPGTAYPATFITTADHDDRVFPGHSFKFAAALQAAQSGPAPVLIRIQTKAGHGAGRPTSMRIEEIADMWTFLTQTLDMNVSG